MPNATLTQLSQELADGLTAQIRAMTKMKRLTKNSDLRGAANVITRFGTANVVPNREGGDHQPEVSKHEEKIDSRDFRA